MRLHPQIGPELRRKRILDLCFRERGRRLGFARLTMLIDWF